MRPAYTLKEFKEQYPDPEIYDFFKHIDRKTMDVDFFDFFGIDKSMIKADNDHHYSIPVEVAPLLAGMIRAFRHSYGKNQQGRTKGTDIKVSYERYHKYVLKMQEEIEKLEPYQQALIKNFHSYDNTKIIDLFLPMLLERLSMLMVMLFCHDHEQTSDNFITMIHELDRMIDSLAHQHCQQPSSAPDKSIFTFNDAISNTFHLLINHLSAPPNASQVNSLELTTAIQNTLQKSKPNIGESPDEFCVRVTSELNETYAKFLSNHQDIINLHNKNIEHEVQLAKDHFLFNNEDSIKSIGEVLYYSQLPFVYEEVSRVVEMVNGHGQYGHLKGKLNNHNIPQEIYDSLPSREKDLLDCYKYEIFKYKTDIPENTKEYAAFVNQRIKERTEFLEHAASQQAELFQATHLIHLNNFLQNETTHKQYLSTFSSLSSMVTTLLTQQLKLH